MNIDIIEPYPEEILFSWFLRMARFYGFNTFSVNMMKNFKSMLLSTSSKQLFNIYVPEFLDHLVKVINLPNSNYFQSYISIIEGMSVFPFYSAFVDEDVKDKYYRVFRGATSTMDIESAFNIRNSGSYYEGSLNIKICPLCIQEKGDFYLNREHQIQNNYICYEHKTILKCVKFNHRKSYTLNEMDRLDYVDSIQDNDISLNIRIKIALAIHDIFENKLKDSLDTIKAKLRKKLRMLHYTNTKDIFINIEDFWHDFNKYNILTIDDIQLFRMLYSTTKETNPIAYLTVILFLFSSLDEFNDFQINPNESERIYRDKYSFSVLYKPLTNIKLTRDDLNIKLEHKNNEFEVVQVIDYYHVMIKHKICNNSWPLHKESLKNKIKCLSCSSQYRYNKYKTMVDQLADGYEFLQQDPEDISRIIVLHKECNTSSSISIKYFKNGQRCTKCKIINNFKKHIYDLVGDEYILLNYEADPKKSVFLHNDSNCLKEIYTSNSNFLKLQHCTKCGKDKNHKYIIPRIHKSIDLRSNYTAELKQQIVDAYHNGKRKCDIIREYNIAESSLYRWIAKIDNTSF